MRFFAPERLKELGLEEFDAFLTTFGRTEARREPTPTGSGLHVRERQRTGSTCPRCAAPCGTRSPTWSAAPTWA